MDDSLSHIRYTNMGSLDDSLIQLSKCVEMLMCLPDKESDLIVLTNIERTVMAQPNKNYKLNNNC
jgi:hypothetical protein